MATAAYIVSYIFFCVCNKSEDCNVTVYRHFSLIDFDTVSLRTNCNQVKRSHLRVSAYRQTARASKKRKYVQIERIEQIAKRSVWLLSLFVILYWAEEKTSSFRPELKFFILNLKKKQKDEKLIGYT